jgi:peroxiredoxin
MEKKLTFYPSRGFRASWIQKLDGLIDEEVDVEVRWIQDTVLQVWNFDAKTEFTPIRVNTSKQGSNEILTFTQGDEQIAVLAESTANGSMVATLPVFQSTLTYMHEGMQTKGIFRDEYRGENYQVFFSGYPAKINFMDLSASGIEGRWDVEIIRGEERSRAIGLFEQFGKRVYGTFLTKTGDYRFLEGELVGDSFYVSGFDGRHLYRFTGILKGDSIVRGSYASGNHFLAEWVAKRNDGAQLEDPTSLTQHQGHQISFSLEGVDGKTYTLQDERFQNKVILLQIMGSWCPNCMDESMYFREIYPEFHDQGLEIIALGFEHRAKSEASLKKLRKASDDLELPYPVLFAGSTKEVKEVLPQIENFMSFPTTIFIDRKGKIRRIHTGFSGPSTGKFYAEYKEDTESFIRELLSE